MKEVQAVAHSFDCCPGHVQISGRGSGTNVRIATNRAVDKIFEDARLANRRIHNFKIAVVVLQDSPDK